MAAPKEEQITKLAQAKAILKAKGWNAVDWSSMSYDEILKAAGIKK